MKQATTRRVWTIAALLAAFFAGTSRAGDWDELKNRFRSPTASSGTVTLWWLNGTLTKEAIREQMTAMRDRCGFSGVAPLTMFRMKPPTEPAYLFDGYFEMYGHILNTARELGMTVVFYDDCDFPSGTAGEQMRTRHPEHLMKYLARGKTTVEGPGTASVELPAGRLMAAVAKNLTSGERRVVTSDAACTEPKPDRCAVAWKAPAGRWEFQAFVCATAPAKRFVDCLDPDAVQAFVKLTYDRFYERYREHFGTTIRMTFFDDLSVYHAPDCAAWTPSFNERFQKKHGRSPEPYYPALWEDIGPETEAARAQLLGFRNELFAAGYPGVTEAWCAKRGLKASGHPACSYRANPLQGPGDGLLFYKYQGFPLTDYIHYWHHGIDGFKIPASAAYNFDRPLLVCEIYGNFHQTLPNDGAMLYRAGMEVYARGVNFLLPHGTWWDDKKMRIVPEISWRNPEMAAELPNYNRWAGRCEMILRQGRHVADVGLVYPIADLAARYNFNDYANTHGKDAVPGTDYYDLMRLLTGEVRRDFTLLHPETIDERCRVDGDRLVLDNRDNREQYRVVILPACRTIPLSNFKKIKDFYDRGGRVLATTCLPEKSVEFGQDAEVVRLAAQMFGPGGRGRFVKQPDEKTLAAALDSLDLVWDVRISNAPDLPRRYRKTPDYGGKVRVDPDAYEGGNRQFAYLHKSLPDAEFYFFANSSNQPIESDVQLRGQFALERWDPRSGEIHPLDATHGSERGEPVTRLKLRLEPLQAAFVVGRAPAATAVPAAAASLEGRVFCGYQGWFAAPGDGGQTGWHHYGGGAKGPEPGHCTFDLWPDLTEMDPDERYPTGFRHQDGRTACLFSSANRKTVGRHFAWMKQHGIDGVFLQRFGVSVHDATERSHCDTVLANVRAAAKETGRVWSLMYDLSGLRAGEIERVVIEDFKRLSDAAKCFGDESYLRHTGKPLVAVWGIGFNDHRAYSLDECERLVRFLKSDPKYGGNAVLVGVPAGWRTLSRDAMPDKKLHEIIRLADVVSPWNVGRYGTDQDVRGHAEKVTKPDVAWCHEKGLAYMPVVFPGFSWHNLMKARGRETPLNAIPRRGGDFFWTQAEAFHAAGAKTIYVAMFDEIDEGTAIFKCTNDPPVGASPFVTYEGLPPDHYLRLAGKMGRLLRGEK